MASSGAWHGGGRRHTDDGDVSDFPSFGSPYSSDIWDPYHSSQLGFTSGDDVSALARAHVDWRETDKQHIFRVDLPGNSLTTLFLPPLPLLPPLVSFPYKPSSMGYSISLNNCFHIF